MTVKELKDRINRLPDELDDIPICVFSESIKKGSSFCNIEKIVKVGKSKEDISCVEIVVKNSGENLQL